MTEANEQLGYFGRSRRERRTRERQGPQVLRCRRTPGLRERNRQRGRDPVENGVKHEQGRAVAPPPPRPTPC